MINQIHIGRVNPSSVSLLNGDSLGMSETGEFDFLNYLLGLQTDSTVTDIEMESVDMNQATGSKNLTDSDQVLLEVFDKKDQAKNSLLQMHAFAGSPLTSLQQPQVEAPLPLEGSGKADWTPIQNLKSNQSSKTKADLGFQDLEDPLAKVAFEAAMKTQTQQAEKSEAGNSKLVQPGVLQQRGKQVQAFNFLNKEAPRSYESISGMEKNPLEKASFETLPIEGADKPKKKSTEPLEFGFADTGVDTSNKMDSFQPKEVTNHRVSHVPVPEVFHKVESMVHQGGGKMTLVLSPPELGQVEIHVSTKGKNVEVSVKSDNDFAKMAIEGQVADLQQSLQSQDLNLAKIEVHVSREMDPSFLENQYAGFSRQGSFDQQSESYRRDGSTRSPWMMEATEINRQPMINTSRASARWSDSRVDIRI
ncbi:MAG: flagellar hook-length control protein FliK [Proteobacteria bacterium]|nr:flagellar hook-length control protein FliK [Pseudomonadota bacterium]